ncbi:MAG: DNA polymerase III subunit delta' [Rhodobacteraceae bacterium]|nr:DNA polymerase III subunit delta' [Paracoccaceae bacterium]
MCAARATQVAEAEEVPEADKLDGAPHPRDTMDLLGHGAQQAAFLEAAKDGRLHHAWLLTGPRGVGKATFAWRAARYLRALPAPGDMLAEPAPADMAMADDHPVARRISALSDPGVFLLRRAWDQKLKRLKTVITVDEARRLTPFFGMALADGGYRAVIVDSADEMNPNAANALLKLLEEPPERCVLFLISHRPARLLPTIRSRCRTLRFDPLSPENLIAALAATGHQADDALAELSAGSVGEAIRQAQNDGTALYAGLIGLLDTAPNMDRTRARALADACAGRGSEARYDLILRLIDLLLARLARAGVGMALPEAAPGEPSVLARLSQSPAAARRWAELAETLAERARHGRAVNLDPAVLVLDLLLAINGVAGDVLR